jgi:hypothetical protein
MGKIAKFLEAQGADFIFFYKICRLFSKGAISIFMPKSKKVSNINSVLSIQSIPTFPLEL